MFSIVEVFYLVFSQLAVGGVALLLLVPQGLVGANFYRLMGGIYLLVIGFARCAMLSIHHQEVNLRHFFTASPNTESLFTLLFFVSVFLWTLSWWFNSPIFTRILFFIALLCGGVVLFLSPIRYLKVIPSEAFLIGQNGVASYLLFSAQFLSAATLLGAVNSGMWFGHWYLVTPDLPIHYLKRFNSVLLASLIGTTSFFGLALFLRWKSTDVVPFNLYYHLIFSMRLLIGLGGTLFLYFITWDCLRDKWVAIDAVGATRAATGFLFIAILTVFIGEFCSRLLLLEMRFVL